MTERVQKVLASLAIGSRRQIEAMIKAGRIQINGRTVRLGDRMQPGDKVKVDGRLCGGRVHQSARTRVLAYYKPAGEICTQRDPEGRRTVFQHLPRLKRGRWISIGRLDFNTTGLLLFTNNGELANRLMHPGSVIEREYAVRVLGRATPRQLHNLRAGVTLEEGTARFTDIVDSGGAGSNHWYHVVIMAGRNREVRRLWESQGLTVSRLIRTRYGAYILPRKRRPGQFWELTADEIRALQADTG